MKKSVCLLSLFVFIITFVVNAQNNNTLPKNLPEVYVTTQLLLQELQNLAKSFSIDKATKNDNGTFDVKIYLSKNEYQAFENLHIPYKVCENQRAYVQMANNYQEMAASWNRYPTYSAYLQIMEKFQNDYPQMCSIDTILTATPGGHSILCAHIKSPENDNAGKPSFFYTSTMHGDEVVGYYFLIRLIDKLLSEYSTNENVKNLVDNIDIWICPLHNPDGTYRTSDNQINESPISTRANANNVDINRTFPKINEPLAKPAYEPEVSAMMLFLGNHNFTIAANLHGGAEVFNYPWDTYMTWQKKNADYQWWEYVGHNYADTCHKYSYFYMKDEDNGVTPGGDWYVITGSMQDYHNFFLGSRHVTLEVGANKVQSSSTLPNYWNYAYRSLLNFIAEADYGIHGIVTDSLTGEPLNATIFIENHDKDHSYVETSMPYGDYHRPIKAGTYQITYSSPGYLPKTIQITTFDGHKTAQDVQLVKNTGIESYTTSYSVYPNPSNNRINIECSNCAGDIVIEIFDASNRSIKSETVTIPALIDVSDLSAGVYYVKINDKNENSIIKFIKR